VCLCEGFYDVTGTFSRCGPSEVPRILGPLAERRHSLERRSGATPSSTISRHGFVLDEGCIALPCALIDP
jgi:hypothetical protein